MCLGGWYKRMVQKTLIKKKIKAEEGKNIVKPNREGKCTVAYRAILLSHRQLSKAWLFLKSCPHGFIRGKSSDSTKKRERERR